ncbi:hypothetical protein [Ramlibacter rhizophilus]|uniref:DUF4230 domain-containing protein n=1 Tax=Ramlibacter rhizophilus TaxID=1781167 RepID=A0A4Z0BG82_9BURK|nr:hypothetical protein [Ramlibacter rhizophilus]TFY97790.1 hypothetical protein EZ242_15090 [Ramlibacter rhizophilus]
MPPAETPGTSEGRPRRRWAAAAVLLALGAAALYVGAPRLMPSWTVQTMQERVTQLDPAQIVHLRTPGGLLEVTTLERLEEFAWKSQYTCRFFDCASLLPPTISRVRARASYVYRLPLAAQWTLHRAGDHYRLTVPALELQEPVGFATDSMEIVTEQNGIFSPPKGENRERLIRELGPELARRGKQAPYLASAQAQAERTVREFAARWMREQGSEPALPIRVVFAPPPP